MEMTDTRDLLPSFVRRCTSLPMFWSWIKEQSGQYEPRRKLIRSAFAPLIEHFEHNHGSPADKPIANVLESFDEDGVHRAWEKALARRSTDPEGAITAARTLVETVCKRILEEHDKPYGENDDLPKLYHSAAELLKLAPAQHLEAAFKTILGNCQSVVNTLGMLRNKLGDAHGKGRQGAKPEERHAALAVNLAGTMATFLVQTHQKAGQNRTEGAKLV
jgi:hypothetical protein